MWNSDNHDIFKPVEMYDHKSDRDILEPVELCEYTTDNFVNPRLFEVHGRYDYYDRWILYTKLGLNMIDKIELHYDNNIITISRQCIQVFNILNGQHNTNGFYDIPLPIMHSNQHPQVRLYCKSIKDIIHFLKLNITKHVNHCDNLTNIISGFIDFDDYYNEVGVYARGIKPFKTINKTMVTNYLTYVEHEYYISEYQTWFNLSLSLGEDTLITKIIITFEYTKENNNKCYIPILENGFIITNNYSKSFTGRMTHVIDKMISNKHVPTEPIYTITFANTTIGNTFSHNTSFDDITKMALKINDRLSIDVDIMEQSKPVIMYVIYEKLNIHK